MGVFTWRNVSGTGFNIEADHDTPLLWVLRNVLGMTGTKSGRGMALCGATTVHIDGVATRSCVTLVEGLGESRIATIKAIGTTATGGRIRNAWLEHQVAECGCCQAGEIMSAAAPLISVPPAIDADIDVVMSGNICRCGT